MPALVRGSFQAFSLDEILGVLALSRQRLGLRFSDAEGEVGIIAVKAGQVVGAEDFRTRNESRPALKSLIGDPGLKFEVVMLSADSPGALIGAAIGGLSELFRGEETADAKGGAEPPAVERPPPPPSPSARPSDAGEAILEGSVSDASFEEILEVMQLSDQSLEVSFMRSGAEIGALTVLSERVLAARAGALRGMEAFRALSGDHGETFEVRRAERGEETGELGGVSELLTELRIPPRPAPAAPGGAPEDGRALFMQGPLSDFPMDALIASLDLSRQPIELELRRGGQVLHRLRVKSGFVVAAESVAGDGHDAALAGIRADPGEEFLVYRCRHPAEAGPVAALSALFPETGEAAAPPAPPPGPADTPAAPPVDEPVKPGSAEADTVEASKVLSQTAVAVATLLTDLEDTHGGAIQEIRAALALIAPPPDHRRLLRSILAVQIACLVAIAGLIALAFL